MQTIKWTQTSGAVNLIPTKSTTIINPKTDAFSEYALANPDAKLNEVRGIVIYDRGTIHVLNHNKHLYVVNENGKTVETV